MKVAKLRQEEKLKRKSSVSAINNNEDDDDHPDTQGKLQIKTDRHRHMHQYTYRGIHSHSNTRTIIYSYTFTFVYIDRKTDKQTYIHIDNGLQRGCGRCDGPGHPPGGASTGPVFFKTNVGKMTKRRENCRYRGMMQHWGHPRSEFS